MVFPLNFNRTMSESERVDGDLRAPSVRIVAQERARRSRSTSSRSHRQA